MRLLPLALVLPLGVLIAGCQMSQPRVIDATIAPRPQGVEGRWAATGGAVAYTANFGGGRFTSVEDRTGALLAEGTYRIIGPGQVRIDYTRPSTGEQIAANCNQRGDRMSCAASTGASFGLVRI
ncbi:hypothetical protein [Consotaella aegiceratis]|uniref:hypothetical protein n=1 Tax=Consotaella aegiceratis TaxID=3097961 RepID=UPI002F3E416B